MLMSNTAFLQASTKQNGTASELPARLAPMCTSMGMWWGQSECPPAQSPKGREQEPEGSLHTARGLICERGGLCLLVC